MMRVVGSLADLEPVPQRAVIINCGTKWVTTLALASTLRNAACPVLLIDCESSDGSRAHFEALARAHAMTFDWLGWPLRPHGVALDALFGEIPDDRVLLVDSDIELLSPDLVPGMRAALAEDARAYGSGFVHASEWLGGPASRRGYYVERMWIPFTMLRTSIVRDALRSGASFADRRVFRPGFATLIGRGLQQLHVVRHARSRAIARPARTAPTPAVPSAESPAYFEFDTGADLHQLFRADGYVLAEPTSGGWGDVRHFHGVTRASLIGGRRALARHWLGMAFNDTPQAMIASEVRERLARAYGIPSNPT